MISFAHRCGLTLLAGGALVMLVNAILTPLMLIEQQTSAPVMAKDIFLLRGVAAGVAALLLIFGCIGVHLVQRHATGIFGGIAFFVSLVGCSLVFAVEWANVFVLRAIAKTNATVLGILDKNWLMNIGFASGIGLFMLGWLLLSISIWRARILPRWPAVTVAIGLVSIPTVGATPLGSAGAMVGNAIFGIGLMGLGSAVSKIEQGGGEAN